jgi:hypothetical protein
MSGHRTVRALAVAAGALLCSAVVAASAVERPSAPTADGRVGAAGVSQSPLVDEPSTTVTTVVVTTVAAPTTTLPPQTTRTTAPRSTTTTPILPPGAPLPPIPNTPVTGIPNAPPASSWQGEGQGVTLRLRIEPATPVAGQAARFVIDVSTSDPCCTVLLDFGDGSAGWTLNNSRSCEPSTLLKRGPLSVSTTHTYAAPGAYKATLSVFTGDSCTNPPLAPGAAPPPPFLGAANVTACIGVGPGTAAQQGCSPFPTFGPDSIISPVLDPFCQVRSDCTQASPPR